MQQGQCEPMGHYYPVTIPVIKRSSLLQRHPVLTPLILLCSAAALAITSFFTDALFPVLSYAGLPATLLCLAIAIVLGLCGVLTAIIGIIESVDRFFLAATVFLKSKEQSYANRN